jgi:hypothetical protein
MVPKAKCGGSGSGCFVRFLFLAVVFFVLIGPLLRCAQQLPQMAGNAASHAASGVKTAASNKVSSLGRQLLDAVEGWWGKQSEAEKFNRVCEHLGVEGVDKLCPYFTSALQGATEADATETDCYLTAAGTGTGGQERLEAIQNTCPKTSGDVSVFQSCVQTYVQTNVESGDWASCMPQAPSQFAREVHTMIQPIACIPGLPKAWCETSSPDTATTPTTSPATRTDPNYMNCLQKYYQLLPNYNQPLSCGTTIKTAKDAVCARATLLSWPYQGQHFGVAWVASCDGMPQQ